MSVSPQPAASTSGAPPAGGRDRPLFDAFFFVAVAGVLGLVVRVVWFTPLEAAQGAAQKIYYIHVPAALSAYLALFIVAVMSVVYLWLRDERSDRLAESAAEVALLFTTVVLCTGPLWGKPVWGTWWTWDARLTLTLFLWFVTASYLVLRGAVDDDMLRARYSAVLGVMAALLVPFIHLSVYMFRTLHPAPIVLKPERPSLPAEMLVTFVLGVVAFLIFCVALVRARYRLAVRRAARGTG